MRILSSWVCGEGWGGGAIVCETRLPRDRPRASEVEDQIIALRFRFRNDGVGGVVGVVDARRVVAVLVVGFLTHRRSGRDILAAIFGAIFEGLVGWFVVVRDCLVHRLLNYYEVGLDYSDPGSAKSELD